MQIVFSLHKSNNLLLLLFIPHRFRRTVATNAYFNTTLVTVYPMSKNTKENTKANFNTTLVTVYRYTIRPIQILAKFQYNSCYCLSSQYRWKDSCSIISIQLLLLFIRIYFRRFRGKKRFQYNSCYCLSKKSYWLYVSFCKFQYNSCYCLSFTSPMLCDSFAISIQLLLLFISWLCLDICHLQKISIQLLLLFITHRYRRRALP